MPKRKKQKEILCNPKTTKVHIAGIEITIETLIHVYFARYHEEKLDLLKLHEKVKIVKGE
jgi:hypothetical protein